jgi:hypothetical protein
LEENFLLEGADRRICRKAENLRKFARWRTCEKGPVSKGRVFQEPVMSQFIDRHPNASLWLIAVAQGVAMLGINVVLRALVS